MGITPTQACSMSIINPQYQQSRVFMPSIIADKIANCFEMEFPSYLSANHHSFQYSKAYHHHTLHNYKLIMPDQFSLNLIRLNATNPQCLWKMLSEGESIDLQLNHKLRLGEVELQLKELVLEDTQLFCSGRTVENNSKCRICFEDEETDLDPLISLCLCEGTIKKTHFKCLKRWLQKSIKEIKAINCHEYEYNPLICDLCKSQIPISFIHEGKRFSFIEMDELTPPYAIFQAKLPGKRKLKSYRIKLYEGLTMTIGRSNEAQISITNSTISRQHCKLLYTNKKLYVKDQRSTYGTMHHNRSNQLEFRSNEGVIFALDHALFYLRMEEKQVFSLEFPQVCSCASSHLMTLKIKEQQSQASEFDFFTFI